MTLEEAIEHAKEVARTCDNSQCAKDHERLAKWLEELRLARESMFSEISQMTWTISENHKLKAENAKLRRSLEILKAHGIEIVDAVAGGFEIYDEEHARADRLEAENDRLREMVRILCYCMHESTDCDGCRLNDGRGEMELDALWACDGLHERLRELGIEVPS